MESAFIRRRSQENSTVYEYAMRSSDFKAQRKAILDKFYVPTHALGAFKQRLKDIYGIDYDRAILKDEL